MAGTVDNTILAQAVDNPVQANVADVKTGATVDGIYLKVEVVATSSAALPNCYMLVGIDDLVLKII